MDINLNPRFDEMVPEVGRAWNGSEPEIVYREEFNRIFDAAETLTGEQVEDAPELGMQTILLTKNYVVVVKGIPKSTTLELMPTSEIAKLQITPTPWKQFQQGDKCRIDLEFRNASKLAINILADPAPKRFGDTRQAKLIRLLKPRSSII